MDSAIKNTIGHAAYQLEQRTERLLAMLPWPVRGAIRARARIILLFR